MRNRVSLPDGAYALLEEAQRRIIQAGGPEMSLGELAGWFIASHYQAWREAFEAEVAAMRAKRGGGDGQGA